MRSLIILFTCLLLNEASATPNLVLFLADDMSYTDVGCYGSPDVKTPHIDRMAEEGIRFDRFYCSAPTCSPLRQSLYTGLYPVRNGAHPNHSRVYDGIQSLPHYLEKAGYRTALVGKRHEAPADAFPFEFLGGQHGDSGKTPDWTDLPLEKAETFIESCGDQPWCLVVTSNQPHTAWNRGDSSAYPPDSLTVYPHHVDTAETREGMSHYYAEITYMDAQVGKVREILSRQGAASNTAMIWLSEQGSQLPFGKWTCYDPGIHSAAVMIWPGTIKPSSSSDALLSYVDVVPTFLEIAGLDPKPLKLDGRSFVPVLTGETTTHHSMVYAVNTTRGIYRGSEAFGIRAATDGSFLYIRNLHPENEFSNSVTTKGKIYASWKTVDTDFARSRVELYRKRPAEEFFDLKTDPFCLNNLADQSDLSHYRQVIDQWMKQQGDKGDETERSALKRQPEYRPWSKKGTYRMP